MLLNRCLSSPVEAFRILVWLPSQWSQRWQQPPTSSSWISQQMSSSEDKAKSHLNIQSCIILLFKINVDKNNNFGSCLPPIIAPSTLSFKSRIQCFYNILWIDFFPASLWYWLQHSFPVKTRCWVETGLKTCRDLVWRPQLPHDGTPAHWRRVCSLGNCFPPPLCFLAPHSCPRPRRRPPDALIAMDCELNSGESRSRYRKCSAFIVIQASRVFTTLHPAPHQNWGRDTFSNERHI